MAELASWNDGATRRAIIDFVTQVTSAEGSGFVAPDDRIATFDNDGTLWCEKPTYVQADFILRKWGAMAAADPTLRDRQPYRAVVERDMAWLGSLLDHVPELLAGIGDAFGGKTTDEFESEVRAFFQTVKHPTMDVSYALVGYTPMRELIDYLEANGFTVFICTGGGRDFVRVVGQQMYGIPRHQVIGSSSVLEYRDGRLVHTTTIEQPIDDGPGKPVHIFARTGQLPLLAAGNSDGDIQMLESARFGLLVHHDDGAREFAYDAGAEHALAQAKVRGWTVVSMQADWSRVF
jgi:phosphoserine phosphatase